jgi:tRNA-specific 2-thiouridylase
MKEKTCIALFSGGLDSMLSVLMMEKLGFKVIPINFNIGVFFKKYIRSEEGLTYKKPLPPGMTVRVVDISKDFLQMLKNPPHGYGKNMNPCIDCKIIMMRKAKEMMEELGAGFVITGEVLGQRPMTQNGIQIKNIQKESGLGEYLLRPLSAKNLEPTAPEKLGWVDRDSMLAIEGRNRQVQLSMAENFGIQDVMETPGGGCLLTDENYGMRVRDLIEHMGDRDITEKDMFLLSVGRQLRKGAVKFIIGRHEEDNEKILQVVEGAWVFEVMGCPGPIAITFDNVDDEAKRMIAAATARYTKLKDEAGVEVKAVKDGVEEILRVKPLDVRSVTEMRIDR